MDIDLLSFFQLVGLAVTLLLSVLAALTQTHETVLHDGKKKLNRWGKLAISLTLTSFIVACTAKIIELQKKHAEEKESRIRIEQQISYANETLNRLESQSVQIARGLTRFETLKLRAVLEIPANTAYMAPFISNLHRIAVGALRKSQEERGSGVDVIGDPTADFAIVSIDPKRLLTDGIADSDPISIYHIWLTINRASSAGKFRTKNTKSYPDLLIFRWQPLSIRYLYCPSSHQFFVQCSGETTSDLWQNLGDVRSLEDISNGELAVNLLGSFKLGSEQPRMLAKSRLFVDLTLDRFHGEFSLTPNSPKDFYKFKTKLPTATEFLKGPYADNPVGWLEISNGSSTIEGFQQKAK
jgi:hypothetical protein